jgi:WXXGXW repeat (2 copies)
MLRRSILGALVAASLGAMAAPSTAAQVGMSINVGPPAERYEVVPAPRRGYDWRAGYWDWNRSSRRHHWVAGSWVRSRPGYTYNQPRWVDRGGRWEQQRGAWSRGDRDGDGVPNNRDRAPDNPRRN